MTVRSATTLHAEPAAQAENAESVAKGTHLLRDLRRLCGLDADRSPELLDLQQDHRHVVVLRRGANERRDLAKHPLPELGRRQMRMFLDQLRQTELAEAVVAFVHRFA